MVGRKKEQKSGYDSSQQRSRNRSFFDVVHEMCTKSLFSENPLRKSKTRKPLIMAGFRVARCKGFEPLTFWSVARRSIQLS